MQRTAVPFDAFVLPAIVPIADVGHRDRVAVGGVVTALAPSRWGEETRALDATITDSSGSFTVGFLGRRRIPGVEIGRAIIVGGAVIQRHGRLTMMNPRLWLVADEEDLDDDRAPTIARVPSLVKHQGLARQRWPRAPLARKNTHPSPYRTAPDAARGHPACPQNR